MAISRRSGLVRLLISQLTDMLGLHFGNWLVTMLKSDLVQGPPSPILRAFIKCLEGLTDKILPAERTEATTVEAMR